MAAAVTRCAVQVRSASSTGTSAPSAGSGRRTARSSAVSASSHAATGAISAGQATGVDELARAPQGDRGRHLGGDDRAHDPDQPGRDQLAAARAAGRGGQLPARPRPGRLGEHDADQERDRQDRPPQEDRGLGEQDDAADDAGHAEEQAEVPDPPSVLGLALQGRHARGRRFRELHRAGGDGATPRGEPPRAGQQHAGNEHGDEQHDSDEAAHGISVPSFSAVRGRDQERAT